MNTTTTPKTAEQLYAEAAVAMSEKRFVDSVNLVEQAQALEAEAARSAAQAEKEEAARQAEITRREALRSAPEPAHFTEVRQHWAAISAELTASVEMDVDSLHYKGLKGHVTIGITEPRKNITETDQGPNVHWVAPELVVRHRGAQVHVGMDFRAEQEQVSRYSIRAGRSNGKMRLSVGSFGERKSFPQRKDKTYDYAGIAAIWIGELRDRERKYQDAVKIAANKKALAALREKFALKEYDETLRIEKTINHGHYGGRGNYVTYAADAGKLFLKLETQVTPEQAEIILNAARVAGVKL